MSHVWRRDVKNNPRSGKAVYVYAMLACIAGIIALRLITS